MFFYLRISFDKDIQKEDIPAERIFESLLFHTNALKE